MKQLPSVELLLKILQNEVGAIASSPLFDDLHSQVACQSRKDINYCFV